MKIKRTLISLSQIILAALLFFLSHPNALFEGGLGYLGFFYLVPVFIFIAQSRLKTVWLYGALYGALAYGSFCFWLALFHPLTIYLVCFLYAVICALLFLVLKLVFTFTPERFKFFALGTAWLSYEYIKSLGFLGFEYGITGYTQWKNPLMLALSSVGGVWLCSFVCILCSVFISIAFYRLEHSDKKKYTKEFCLPLGFAALTVGFSFLLGFVLNSVSGTSKNQKTVGVVLVQDNVDPWKGGVASYSSNLKTLMSLTDDALKTFPDAKIVVWPETAFVPSVAYQYKTRGDYDRYQLVLSLLSYIQEKDRVFVLGNQHSVDEGKIYTDDYNAALVFDPQKNSVIPPQMQVYAKQHLVPFTEYFPYQKIFPHLYEALLQGDTHLWTPGQDSVVFETDGLYFSTPICFEDTFGSGCREFVKNGARCFVNMSNDAWSKSLPCQMQHLSMAVFRSAENHIPSVRSTASGMTCFIDERGAVVSMSEPFTKAWLYCEVPIIQNFKPTLYTRFGSWLPLLSIIVTAAFVIYTLLANKIKNR